MPRPRLRGEESQLRGIVVLLITALLAPLLSAAVPPAPAAAATPSAVSVPVVTRSEGTSLTVSMTKASAAIAPTGSALVTITATTSVKVSTFQVRLRIRRPSGKLVYQRTVERYGVKPGPVTVGFVKSFADLDLREGRYTIEARIQADSKPAILLTDRIFVVEPKRSPLPVVVVARFNCSPMTDADGRFVIDPATSSRGREEAQALAAMFGRNPALRLTLGIPPLELDQWMRVTSGYQLVAPEGVRTVGKDAPVTGEYSAAVSALRRIARDPRLELLDVPFAEPDLAGLRSIGGMDDLKRHYDRGFAVYQASLGATPSAGTAVLGDSIPAGALPVLTAEHVDHAVLKPSSLAVSSESSPATGVYAISGSKVKGLVLDERGSALLESGQTEALLDRLFAHLTSESGKQPVTLDVRLGTGAPGDVLNLESVLRDLSRSGWIRFETAAQAARSKPAETGKLRPLAYPGRPAPYGYWPEVGQGRKYALSFLSAVSERDDDAAAAAYDSLVAESRCWAGPDNSWSFADRGRSFAAAAFRSAQLIFSKVSITSQNITLSGTSGKIPLSIRNTSGKTLAVTVVAKASHTYFPSGSKVKAILRPADNYVTIPVDLGSGGIYDRVQLSVVAGQVTLASTAVDLHASYIDRLALVATVVIVLVVLLLYIRRKVRTAQADT